MEEIKILVATSHLNRLGGSVTFTYTLIEELKERSNIDVEYFTFEKGIVSDRIENELGVNFKSRNNYDLILANHNTIVEKLYSLGFIIQTCHGIFPSLEQPSFLSDAYVVISQEILNHVGKIDKPIKLIYNGINLKRFREIRPVSKKLKTILSLCQSREANQFIKEICDDIGCNFSESNKYVNPVWGIEELINDADLVIGLGRSAYEAMSCNRPVVIYDKRSYFPEFGDGYISQNLGLSLIKNCSGRYFKKKITKNELRLEILKYDPLDGVFLRTFAEKELDISKNVDEYLRFWKEILSSRKEKKYYLFKYRLKKVIGKKLSFLIFRLKNRIR
ncbi:UDP-Glycosyltransferase/glycogen phosphorylase [Zunongwangia profunda SM-A87]|uniref:UDP-Glycosyltransferase/glycogen phosphorylase n=1 Tax=Zunongwangia profunda (strain DSM 18752 / CCTCC AB 206139 / SM-A87) TaxID=655815 RepID=D5BII9_ZUNPS|nr:UDP-glycosyltransferase [Zunongwangia profunda]ADF51441.1 UDP-Glycosyltransferase/glycogen phosphorylase [Zunongwangia profunda SM-A87]